MEFGTRTIEQSLFIFHSKNPDLNEFIDGKDFRGLRNSFTLDKTLWGFPVMSILAKDDHDGEERDGSNSTLRGVRHFAQRWDPGFQTVL